MDQLVVSARKRDAVGKGAVSKLRREGRIPAVVYGRVIDAMALDLNEIEFLKTLKKVSESTIIKLDVDGTVIEAFVKEANRNIINGKLLHVDFYAIERGKLLRAHVPLHVSGSPAGVREGGILETPLHEIEVECMPKDLPEQITVDVSALKGNESLHARDIVLPAGVKLMGSGDQVVALVKFARAESPAEGAVEASPAAAE
jgi:large subunit ribosomal protein L25